jgi:hypothetical protein
MKDSIASCILYHISEKLSKEPKRRSTRKLNKTPSYTYTSISKSKPKSKSKPRAKITIDFSNSFLQKIKK